jgi:hypothetical protein
LDHDHDGLPNLLEYKLNSNPLLADLADIINRNADKDHDGFSDLEEILLGTDPADADSDPGKLLGDGAITTPPPGSANGPLPTPNEPFKLVWDAPRIQAEWSKHYQYIGLKLDSWEDSSMSHYAGGSTLTDEYFPKPGGGKTAPTVHELIPSCQFPSLAAIVQTSMVSASYPLQQCYFSAHDTYSSSDPKFRNGTFKSWNHARARVVAQTPSSSSPLTAVNVNLSQGTKVTYLRTKTISGEPTQVLGTYTFTIPPGECKSEVFPTLLSFPFTNPPDSDSTVSITYNLLPIDLAIDANRDGTIASGETASQEKPFRFWVNNDSDPHTLGDDVEAAMKEDESSPPDALDWKTPTALSKGEVDGVRDLEDFTRLHLTLPYDIIQKAEAGEAQIGFKWVDGNGPRVRIYKAADGAGGLEYLTSPQKANEQCSGGNHQSVADVRGTEAVYLPASYWQSTWSQEAKRCFLFEGCEEGTARLATVIKLGSSQEVASPGPWIKIMDVRRMFERAKVDKPYSEPSDIPDAWVTGDNPDPVLTHTDDPWGYPPDRDPEETKQYIVHVHGWRMDYPEIQTWAQTTFKRLWHHGYKGRFASFRWPTFSPKTDLLAELNPIDGRLTYNDSEYRAWLSGVALAGYVNSLPSGYTKNVMAHSMGNVVTGAAFRAGMSGVSRYVMFNSAMAHMAYGTSHREFADRVTPDTDPDAETSKMGLANKFLTMPPTTNFYLAPDFAVSVWEFNHAHNKPESIPTFFTERYWNYFPNFPNDIWGENLIKPLGQLNSTGRKLWYKIQTGNAIGPGLSLTGGRVIIKLPEAMAYVIQSRSKPAGNSNIKGGSVQSSIPMDDYGFGSEHSAQWVYSIQKTFECYTRLLKQFGIEPYPN